MIILHTLLKLPSSSGLFVIVTKQEVKYTFRVIAMLFNILKK